jgi:hypothetical protein
MDNERDLRRLVRKSARKAELRGMEAWEAGRWHIYINIAGELGLSDEAIRNEWRRGASRAGHLLEVLREQC